VLRTNSLSLGPDCVIDVANHSMIIQSTAAGRAAALASIRSWIRSGRNNGAWNGSGINSSAAAADLSRITGLAAILNDGGDGSVVRSELGGLPVDVNSILIKWTYNGDGDLNGTLNADDYARIDVGFASQTSTDYYSGDFNFRSQRLGRIVVKSARPEDQADLEQFLTWELFGVPVLNRTNALSNFSTSGGGTLIPVAANAGGWGGRSLINPDKNNIAPRVGFSYQPAPNIVFRGGYGVFYQFINRIGSESNLALNQPFLKAVQTSQGAGSVTPVFQLKNGFPGTTYAASVVPLYLQKNNWQDPNQRTSYVQQASFGTQIQLQPSTVFEMTWVGNWGHKMNRLRNANQGVVTGYASATQALVQFPYANLNTATSTVAGAGTHSFLEYATNDGNTRYNALELSARRTMSNSLRADRVTDPGLATTASQDVLMPTSRSVASSSSCPLVALIRMFDRIGMVLFFTTTPRITSSSLRRFSFVVTKSMDPPTTEIGSSLLIREKDCSTSRACGRNGKPGGGVSVARLRGRPAVRGSVGGGVSACGRCPARAGSTDCHSAFHTILWTDH